MNKSTHFIHLFPPVRIATAFSQKEYDALMKANNVQGPHPPYVNEPANACTHVLRSGNGQTWFIVCLKRPVPKGTTEAAVHALLAHEASHVVDRHMEAYGETSPASEQKAYAIQNITEFLISEYRKKRKK